MVLAAPILGAMELTRFSDVGRFLGFAGPFLAEREAEHNLIFGVANTVRETPEVYTAAPYMAAVGDGPRIIAVALQTPPFRLILSEIDDPAALGVLADDLLERDLPGVVGGVDVVDAFIAEWTARGGRPARVEMAEHIYQLSAVVPPRPVGGRWRVAEPGDRELIAAWTHAFMREALGDDDEPGARAMADRWLEGRGRTLYLWEEGDVVSMTGVGGPTPNGIRIGPVYTPPERRGRGYASALVAAVSQVQLDAGRRFCFLFTDADNPTSNHIYRAIGYEPVRDVRAYKFDPG
jgi:predicted GNAT family acetyltransferase